MKFKQCKGQRKKNGRPAGGVFVNSLVTNPHSAKDREAVKGRVRGRDTEEEGEEEEKEAGGEGTHRECTVREQKSRLSVISQRR